jgi:hypothetical protein
MSEEFRLDRSYFSVARLDEPDDAKAYWLSKSPQERVAAMEFLRQSLYGYDPATTRLQRVLEIAELEKS